MGKRIDLTGQRFGRLTAIEYVGNSKWLCKCECGNEKIVCRGHLKSGAIRSCGCYNREVAKKRMRAMAKEKWQDEEFRQIQSHRIKKLWQDEEFRQMQSNKMKKLSEELWQDEERRQAQSNRLKEQWKDEEFRQIQSDKLKKLNEEQWKDEEFRQMHSAMMKEKWQDEEFRQMQSETISKRMSGDGNPFWKGGVTSISGHLRKLPVVSQWRKDTYARENNICQLTGKKVHGGNSDVHHLYGFNMIVLEAHKLYNIQVKQQVKDYTEEELHMLEEYVTSWHKDTSNAVLLSKEVHELFHNCKDEDGNVLYGYGNNTPEQFEEFRKRYITGEFKDLI